MILDFYLFFYALTLILLLPVLGLGLWISPARKKNFSSPKRILKQLSSPRTAPRALDDFQTYFIDANSCEQSLWFEMIAHFASSKYFDFTQIDALSNRLTQQNPNLKREIENIITLSTKDKK